MNLRPTDLVNVPVPEIPENRDIGVLEKRIPRELQAEARRELLLLIKEIGYQTERARIIGMTTQKKEAIYSRIDEIFRAFDAFEGPVRNPGEYEKRSFDLVDSVRDVVTEELGAVSATVSRVESLLGEPVSKDVRYNFPLIDVKTTAVPLDLHLAFGPETTASEAISRLLRQYRGRYNAVILTDARGVPVGLVTVDELSRHDPETRLSDMASIVPGGFPTLETPREEAEAQMREYGVNVFPVIDAQTDMLIGILTKESVVKVETRLYTTQLQTAIAVQWLHQETTMEKENPLT